MMQMHGGRGGGSGIWYVGYDAHIDAGLFTLYVVRHMQWKFGCTTVRRGCSAVLLLLL